MIPVNGLQQLFNQYVNGGHSYLNSLIENEVDTNLQDFKLFKSTNPNNWGNDDKSNLSKALSGFANTHGGVIVWGVDCRKDCSGPDVVKKLEPIPNLKAIITQMFTLTALQVSPAVPGVEHELIEHPPGSGTGFIVSYIPPSDGAHMAICDYTFRFRSGSSFLRMEQRMVADLFGRRRRPILKLIWYAQGTGSTQGGQYVMVNFALENVGLATAKFPAFALYRSDTFNPAQDFIGPELPHGAVRLNKIADMVDAEFTQDVVIHPGRQFRIGSMNLLSTRNNPQIPYKIYCEDFYAEGTLDVQTLAAIEQERTRPR